MLQVEKGGSGWHVDRQVEDDAGELLGALKAQ